MRSWLRSHWSKKKGEGVVTVEGGTIEALEEPRKARRTSRPIFSTVFLARGWKKAKWKAGKRRG